MKLTHKGTFVDNRVGHKTLDGKEYLVLEVSYNEDVGSAIWFFILILTLMHIRRLSIL